MARPVSPQRESSASSWLGVVNSETQGTFYPDLPFSELSNLWTSAWNSSSGLWDILLRTLIPLFLRRDCYLGSQRCKKIEVHWLQRTENKQLFQQGKCYDRDSQSSGPWIGTSCQISDSIGLEIKCTVNIMCLNHPQTSPLPWKNCIPRNWSWCQKGWGPLLDE